MAAHGRLHGFLVAPGISSLGPQPVPALSLLSEPQPADLFRVPAPTLSPSPPTAQDPILLPVPVNLEVSAAAWSSCPPPPLPYPDNCMLPLHSRLAPAAVHPSSQWRAFWTNCLMFALSIHFFLLTVFIFFPPFSSSLPSYPPIFLKQVFTTSPSLVSSSQAQR